MPQTDAERLLSPRRPVERVTPQSATQSGRSDADRLLTPEGLGFPNPLMEPIDESAVREGLQTEFDFPEIGAAKLEGVSAANKASIVGGLAFALDPAQQDDIIRNNIPGAQINTDRFGNRFVIVPREGAFYINRPGMSPQDFIQLGAIGTTAVPAGRAGAAVGAGLGRRIGAPVLGRVLGAGAAEGALSAAIDQGLRVAGSEQPVNVERAATAALAGGAGEALFTMLTRRLSQIETPRKPVFTENGRLQLSPEARQVVEEAGLDPDTLTQEFIGRLDTELGRAARPAEAVRAAEASSLPVEVPLTRGNVTRANSDQLFEDAASKGAFGRSVESIVTGARQEQQAALRANVEAIQEQVAGGARQVIERGQGGVIAQQALEELRRNALTVVDDAYGLARSNGQAGLRGQAIPRLAFNLERAAFTRVDDAAEIPSAMRQLERLRTLGADVGEDGAVLADALFRWRKTVTNLSNDLQRTSPADANALADMRQAFDTQIVDIVERGLLEGNDDAVDLWLNAIRTRREFGNVWEAVDKDAPNYLVDLLTQTIRDGETAVLKVAPERAANVIFGASRAGLSTNPALARQLQRLRGVLIEGGRRDAWDALREEAMVRLFNQAEGVFDISSATRSFSGARLATAIDNAMTQNAPVMRTLFSQDELNLLEQLKRVAVSLEPRPGGANRSNTSAAASQMFQSVFGRLFGRVFGPTVQAAARSDSFVGDIANLPFVLRAMRTGGAQPQRPSMLSQPGVGAAIGATGATPAADPDRR